MSITLAIFDGLLTVFFDISGFSTIIIFYWFFFSNCFLNIFFRLFFNSIKLYKIIILIRIIVIKIFILKIFSDPGR